MEVDRRMQILNASTKAFSQYGYKATTMDLIAKMANVGKGTIYNFFRNKEELFNEIISRLIDEMQQVAEEAMDQQASFYANLHSALFSILEFRRSHQLTLKLFEEQKEMGTPAVNEMIEKIEEKIIAYIKELLERAIGAGKIKPCNPELTAFVMFKLYVAIIFDWEKHHESLTKEEIAEVFELYLLKGLQN
ncbi:TetR family transcriptional regulator [Weizmannia acidilactici]|uniref:TetR family transcriptional regulator n=1 Tax=Weizmannia acidilactici TaxID=2607726 RepID=A0A5J4JIQ6_9BACI|nr:TetR/AcrR family transcriptional regulator [Weizmannia acidilactici]GER65789.1 TetR family transcriptional regulator [Weizmannia acidilactici]GER71149.1 TetR family transcriptional regulator [Weizmannia acidilactici]GER74862.1 TetR family transcriptional regulator [Weizmannia acidilactici]